MRVACSCDNPRGLYAPMRTSDVEIYSLVSNTWRNLEEPDNTCLVRGNSSAFVKDQCIEGSARKAPEFNSIVSPVFRGVSIGRSHATRFRIAT